MDEIFLSDSSFMNDLNNKETSDTLSNICEEVPENEPHKTQLVHVGEVSLEDIPIDNLLNLSSSSFTGISNQTSTIETRYPIYNENESSN